MKIPDSVRRWFGYNRKERRATIILLVLTAIIIAFRAILPERNIETEDITPEVMALISSHEKPVLGLTRESYATGKKSSNYQDPETDQKTGSVKRKIYKAQTPVDLNSCDSALLESLPGIGPVLAVRILKYRNLLGGFASKEQLKEVYGLPPETFEIIKDKVIAGSGAIRKIAVNTAEYRELSRMPYLENYDVAAILKYRKLKGKVTKMEELTGNNILTEEKALKVAPYLSFE